MTGAPLSHEGDAETPYVDVTWRLSIDVPTEEKAEAVLMRMLEVIDEPQMASHFTTRVVTDPSAEAVSSAGEPDQRIDLRSWQIRKALPDDYPYDTTGASIVGPKTEVVEVFPKAELDRALRQRDHWIRLFNRLDAGVSRWAREKLGEDDGVDITDRVDDALIGAHKSVLKASARAAGSEEENDGAL